MIIVIVGLTVVDKIKMSVKLAKRFTAEFINGQAYRELNIGIAKPTEEDIFYHLFYNVDVKTNYTVFEYQSDCCNKVDEILSKGKNVSKKDYIDEEKTYSNTIYKVGMTTSNLIEKSFNKIMRYLFSEASDAVNGK